MTGEHGILTEDLDGWNKIEELRNKALNKVKEMRLFREKDWGKTVIIFNYMKGYFQ